MFHWGPRARGALWRKGWFQAVFPLVAAISRTVLWAAEMALLVEYPQFWFLPLVPASFSLQTHSSCWVSSAIESLSYLQILTELEHSGIGRIKEQSARMLGHLVSNAPRLIRPYMEPILKVICSRQRQVLSLQAVLGQRECFVVHWYTEQSRSFLWSHTQGQEPHQAPAALDTKNFTSCRKVLSSWCSVSSTSSIIKCSWRGENSSIKKLPQSEEISEL